MFIGSSFVFKKKGLLAAQRKYETTAGESHAYLKSPLWWTGMTIMILGEVLNFVAYMFADAVLVTPMGALSVVISAILSAIFLKEYLTLFGKIGCFLCIVGSVIIAINAPEQKVSGNIREYEKLFIAPGFLTWLGICVVAALILVFLVAPRYGKKNMLVYITVCSVIGGLSVSVTSGLGAAIILSIRGSNQFTYWFTYFLLAFIIVTLLIEINYLNKALELFNTAAVTPTYYVLFTAATIITSVILSQGMRASAVDIVTIVFGFFTICSGIVLLQLSKMDPVELEQQKGVDRKSSMLLSVMEMGHELEHEDDITHIEDPGMDSIRGGMGIVGSIMRAKSSRKASRRHRRPTGQFDPVPTLNRCDSSVPRYQLYDRPVAYTPDSEQHIKFVSGSELPHGHHGWTDAPSPDSRPTTKMDVHDSHAPKPILENGKEPSHVRSPRYDPTTDGDVGDQSASQAQISSYHINLPPIWADDADLDGDKIASPTGIVDDYCEWLDEDDIGREPPIPLDRRVTTSTAMRERSRTASRTVSRAAKDAVGLGLMKLRIPSSRPNLETSPEQRRPTMSPRPYIRTPMRSMTEPLQKEEQQDLLSSSS